MDGAIALYRLRNTIQSLERLAGGYQALIEEQTRDHNPDEVHEEKVEPKIIPFRSTIREVFMVVVEQASGIIQDVSVYLTKGHHGL